MTPSYLIWGIDPGLRHCGYAALLCAHESLTLVTTGIISPTTSLSFSKKLLHTYQLLENLIKQHSSLSKTQYLCVETQFLGKNCSSYMAISCVRAIILLLAEQMNMTILESSPTHAKKTLGKGNMEKKDVCASLQILFPGFSPLKYDESDALLLALTAHFSL